MLGSRNSYGVSEANILRRSCPLAHRQNEMPILCGAQRIQVNDQRRTRGLVPVRKLRSHPDA
jgi:hypothetical protein